MRTFEILDKEFNFYTDAEFELLERHTDGRLVDLQLHWAYLTQDQLLRLHDDDWSYWHDIRDEVEYEYQMLKKELQG